MRRPAIDANADREADRAHRDDEDDARGGEPPCMAGLLDEDGLMPDAPRLVTPTDPGRAGVAPR